MPDESLPDLKDFAANVFDSQPQASDNESADATVVEQIHKDSLVRIFDPTNCNHEFIPDDEESSFQAVKCKLCGIGHLLRRDT